MKAGEIELTPEEIAEVNEVLVKHPTVGDRYLGNAGNSRLWG